VGAVAAQCATTWVSGGESPDRGLDSEPATSAARDIKEETVRSHFFNIRTLILGLMGLAFAACQDHPGPIGVSEAGYETTVIDGVELLNTPPGHRLTPAGISTKIIGPEGGSIESDGGRLIIPAGALALPTPITEIGKEAPHYRYKFGPSGLQFATPATLVIEVDPAALGVDPSRLKIAGGNDLGTDWHVIGGTYDAGLGGVVVSVEHFSQYALCVD